MAIAIRLPEELENKLSLLAKQTRPRIFDYLENRVLYTPGFSRLKKPVLKS